MTRALMFLPPLLFLAIAAAFYIGMQRDGGPGMLPSTFIGAPAPALGDQALPGVPLLTAEALRSGEVTLVNFWASWCPPCRAEHPVLMQMQADGLRIAGVNLRDKESQAQKYLSDLGDPYFAQVFDPRGRTAIDWGVTAPPETFIVAGDGTVLYRFQGPLLGTAFETRFMPALEAALAGR